MKERLATTEKVLRESEMAAFEAGFPGTEEISRLIDAKIASEFNRLLVLPTSAANFWQGTMLIDATNELSSLNVDEFVEKYGAVIGDGGLRGDPREVTRIENEYLRRWPQKDASKQIARRRKEAVAEAQAKVATEQREQAAAEKREEAAERERCSARCTHKCMHPKFANKGLCHQGCINVECEENECIGFCQADCATTAKAGQSECVSACVRGRCGD